MDSKVLSDYLNEHSFPIIVKEKKKYLIYEGLQDKHVYILKSGVIKTSVISKDGREFNIEYINGLEIVSLLKDEYSQFIDAPFNIRVESEKPSFIASTGWNFGNTSTVIWSCKITLKIITGCVCSIL